MRFYLVCLLAAALVGVSAAQARQPRGKQPPNKAAKDDNAPKSSDVPEKTGPDTVGGKTLKQWTDDLSGIDPSRRAIALLAIPSFGDEASVAVKPVLNRLHDVDVSPRAKACLALRIMAIDRGDVPAVVKALGGRLRYLNEKEAVVRYEAVVTLRRFVEDCKPIIDDLLHGMTDGSSWEIRHACVSILWRVAIDSKNGPNEKIVKAMVDRLYAERYPPAYQERLELIIGLGSVGRPKDTQLHARVINALRSYVTSTVASKTLTLWAYAGLVAMDDPKNVDGHLKGLFRFTSDIHKLDVRVQALGALAAFGPKSKKYVTDVIKLLGDKEPMIVNAAAASLCSIGDKNDREQIIEAMLSLLRQYPALRKDASDREKANSLNKAATAVFALANLKANLKDVHDAMDKIRKDEKADRGLRFLIDQAQKYLRNPPKEKDKK
jgi:HEAT repeat protein